MAAATASNPYGSTSVEKRVEDITSKDSALNQMARTEANKVMNRRGMLNSSMAIGAAQDAVTKNALPIASQDAAQAFQGAESSLGRQHETALQTTDIAARERMQGKDIASSEKMGFAQIASTEGLAKAQRALDEKLQSMSITSAEKQQVLDIASREGMAAADRELQKYVTNSQIASEEKLADWDIAADKALAELDYDLQTTIASWNLSSADRNAAAQLLTNMETLYTDSYDAIMSNEYLDATEREAQLGALKTARDYQLDFVQQLYDVDLTWVIAAVMLVGLIDWTSLVA